MNESISAPFLYFQFSDSQGKQKTLQFVNPVEILAAYCVDEVTEVLSKVEQAVASGYYAAGYVSYEAAPAFDSAYKVSSNVKMPLVWFGIYEQPIKEPLPQANGQFKVSNWCPNTERERYNHAIDKIKESIARGDTYQTNYTMRLRADFEGDDLAFYQRLSAAQRADYCAYLNIGRFRILSASPELFFRWEQNKVTARPMKGTMKRGRTLQEDRIHNKILSESIKDRAENVMIVDLLRNDLSRVAVNGSVNVPRLFTIETYPTLFQMTSTIEAQTDSKTTLVDLFTALFPCGSITGAPKVSTMNIIHQLETDPREVYCGAIGYLEPDGEAVFNVAIRTVVIDTDTGRAEYGVGGGITWDSTAEGEYEEALTKARLLTEEVIRFDLLESIRLEKGKYFLLEEHLERLASSAAYFGFPFSRDHAIHHLEQLARKLPNQTYKVRLLLSKEGGIKIEHEELVPLTEGAQPITLADQPVSRYNKFLFHKTTNRREYEIRRNRDVFDVLLWNEEGELTEFTIGNLVMEVEGKLYTPPIDSGLLAGTYRAYLLKEGVIQERLLTLKDYETCDRIWLINSVRGWVPVQKVSLP